MEKGGEKEGMEKRAINQKEVKKTFCMKKQYNKKEN